MAQQKGYKAKKTPTKKEVLSQNNDLAGALQQMQANMQFLGQQTYSAIQKSEMLNKEVGALASLLRRSELDGPMQEVKDGDAVLIDFAGIMKESGKTFEGGFSMGTIVNVGSGSFVPGFEEALLGTKLGQTVDVTVTFPENYPPALKGKEASFKVKVNKIYRLAENDGEIALLHADRLKAEQAEKEAAKAAEAKENASEETKQEESNA